MSVTDRSDARTSRTRSFCNVTTLPDCEMRGEVAAKIEADKIEIHTGEYAGARTEKEQMELLEV